MIAGYTMKRYWILAEKVGMLTIWIMCLVSFRKCWSNCSIFPGDVHLWWRSTNGPGARGVRGKLVRSMYGCIHVYHIWSSYGYIIFGYIWICIYYYMSAHILYLDICRVGVWCQPSWICVRSQVQREIYENSALRQLMRPGVVGTHRRIHREMHDLSWKVNLGSIFFLHFCRFGTGYSCHEYM